ncbi:MAG: enoyl-CoA hydratase-related protein [Salinisphaera sp.]|nr:enoyl-CoA hydratase-related protein [Salinisphaera sp.]
MRIEERPYQCITFSRQGKILTATLNRPDSLNAVNAELHAELSRLFYDLQDDDASDILVLTGAGRAFCAGGDLFFLQTAIDDPDVFLNTAAEAKRILFGQLDLEKPIIARLNGAATGLGASIALCCDVIIAAEHAKIGDPHVCVGLVAGDGGAILWPQLVGFARAKEYLLTGNLMTAAEAERIGLINHAVAAEDLDAKTYGLAEQLAAGATKAIRWTKVTTNLHLKAIAHQVFDAGLAYEHLSNQTADHQEGITAFAERRRPVYRGK